MKVLILTTVMAPYRVKLFEQLGKKCDLTVCFEQKTDKSRDDKWYMNDCEHYKCICLKGWDKSLKKVKFEILSILRKTKPDLVIAYEYSTITAMLLMGCCKLKGIPYMINCDGAFISRSYKDKVKSFYIKHASGLLASGSMAAKYFLHYGANEDNIYFHKFTTLQDGDVLSALPSEEEKNLLKQKLNINHKKNIINVGRFIYSKGIDVLLESLDLIPRDVGVYIIGGVPGQEYEDMVKKQGLDNVYFLDFMKPEELRNYFMASDVFVLPTRKDVWGLVVNEAMACGLPVVTTDQCVAGIELIENGVNGYIIPIDDPEKLAWSVNALLENEEQMMLVKNANLLKIKQYTIEKSADSIYDSMSKVYLKSVGNDGKRK